MAQVSTEGFDLVFGYTNKLEERIGRLEGRIERAQKKLEDLLDDPVTNQQQREVGRLEGLLNSRRGRLDALYGDLFELRDALPKDKFGFNKFRRDLRDRDKEMFSFEVSITDSPYDDTFVGGEGYKVRITGSEPGRRRTRTAGFGGEVEMIDGTTTFRVGGTGFAEISRMDEGEILLLNTDNEVLYRLGFSNV